MNKQALSKTIEALVAKSMPFAVLEFRGGKAEQIKYVAKKTGKEATFEKFTLACETLSEDAQQVTISRDLTEDEKKAGWQNAKAPYKKGQRLLVILSQWSNQYGDAEGRAISIEPIED